MSAASDVSVVIARGELLPAFRERLAFDPGVLVFSTAETSHVLGVIVQRHTAMVALDRQFADSSGGALFIADLRSLRPDSDVRVLTDHGGNIPVMLRKPVLPTGRATIAAASHPVGTEYRRTPRYPVAAGCGAIVNGDPTSLVNVSVAGAQMLSPNVLRPLQHVRVALRTETSPIRIQASIAWSMFERCRGTGQTCYRVGVEFQSANVDLLEAFCSKHAIRV
jgi:hypothetical protein